MTDERRAVDLPRPCSGAWYDVRLELWELSRLIRSMSEGVYTMRLFAQECGDLPENVEQRDRALAHALKLENRRDELKAIISRPND